MKVWINKVEEEILDSSYSNSLVFNLMNKNNKSNIKTHIEDLWRRFGESTISDINEDLIILAMSIFAIDKKVPRKLFYDNWTRSIELNIPVIELERWESVKEQLEDTLSFLSGDKWTLSFRESKEKYRANRINKNYKIINKSDFDCVSLFSGGLDSFCGALNLLNSKKRTCFVGFKEYKMLGGRQNEIFSKIDEAFLNVNKELLLFNTNPSIPLSEKGEKNSLGVEITSRSRSLLFLAGALAVASIIGEVPVYIPENGFIGINVPLTHSRIGSCSTRTTHPYFIKNLNEILKKVGIKNEVINPYALYSKGEIVAEVSNLNVFTENAYKTISCSHPCQSRYDRLETPMNCGYCYPCLIRKASMNKIKYEKDEYNPYNKLSKSFIENNNKIEGKAKDLKAVLYSLNRYINHIDDDNYINMLLMKSGSLISNEIKYYNRVYRESMNEIKRMIENEDNNKELGLLEYLGVDIEEVTNE
ncbi:Qat anti-phage system QueC-like protein QatC [Tissierella praeacuta]|uniref:Qat anti-phage system QueC-like protein QatC n=1 Tax=Tissierella praeacuta TaxID=43131 RepID=UPI0028A93468|nr:Qat anti-phage system QueC-like protein QatC [Tissierella praeacuta]